MEFRIADTFTDSLTRLTSEEQKAVKTAAFDLQINPANPGFNFHRLDKVKDKNFWSVRVSSDIRLIIHKTASSFLLCYVDHHDKAYAWAERRKLETHPKTGAAQLVEIRERVEEITIPQYVEAGRPKYVPPPLFKQLSDDQLLSYGIPSEWLGDVRHANEDSLLDLATHLPSEAAEALLEIATGGKPRTDYQQPEPGLDPFNHPDALRRFRVMSDVEALERALDYPWDKWTIFLHPAQRQLVEQNYSGPARVSGSAGTGKTVVALHRAVFLAKSQPDTRILLTTFSVPLANALETKLKRLVSNQPRLAERIDICAIYTIGERLYEQQFGRIQFVTPSQIRQFLTEAAAANPEHQFSPAFFLNEWEEVIDAWQVTDWESYRDFKRLGRKTRLPEQQRQILWSIFEVVQTRLATANLITVAGMFTKLAEHLTSRTHSPFDFAIIDESQDVSVAQLRFLAALGGNRPNALFFAGDLGQRIFQQPFSWKSLGIEIRGRSRNLHINYRTSHQIRMQADNLLGPEVSDVDGNTENRQGTISVFNGPHPDIRSFQHQKEEIDRVAEWLQDFYGRGIEPHEMGVFVRSEAELTCATTALTQTEIPFKILNEQTEPSHGHASISTMHLAKGLEFRVVVVMACDDEIIPSQQRIETIGDDADLQEVYDTERHLLYVACTRARDYLLVTSTEPASEFLDDLQM
jgi:mRNA-degrading endonuclease RelE of RelBE toxin-antitoxin system